MGRIRKCKSCFCLLIAAVFALTWLGGCQSADNAKTKENVKTEVSEQKKSEEEGNSGADEKEIPEELLPGRETQTEGDAPDAQESKNVASVFNASDGSGAAESVPDGPTGGSGHEESQETGKNTEIQISITVESQVVGNLVAYADVLTLKRGTTAYDALIALLGDQVAASGGYVTGIGGLSEKDYGAKSGWMYSVNGTRPNKGSTSYTLQDGDEVVWSYVK